MCDFTGGQSCINTAKLCPGVWHKDYSDGKEKFHCPSCDTPLKLDENRIEEPDKPYDSITESA